MWHLHEVRFLQAIKQTEYLTSSKRERTVSKWFKEVLGIKILNCINPAISIPGLRMPFVSYQDADFEWETS